MRKISIGFLLVRLFVSAMLLLALLRHPYSYYTLLRWIVCGVSAYSTFKSIEAGKTGWAWVFGIIVFLFNPIIPIHLSREIWAFVDTATALIFILSIFTVRVESNKSN